MDFQHVRWRIYLTENYEKSFRSNPKIFVSSKHDCLMLTNFVSIFNFYNKFLERSIMVLDTPYENRINNDRLHLYDTANDTTLPFSILATTRF